MFDGNPTDLELLALALTFYRTVYRPLSDEVKQRAAEMAEAYLRVNDELNVNTSVIEKMFEEVFEKGEE